MKNLKAQFKLIIYLFLSLSVSNVVLAKKSDKFHDAEDVSNYFSGILSTSNNQYEKSYSYLKSLNNLEDSHHIYIQYYQYSLINLNKFKEAANYTKKLQDKKLDNFESNLISTIYYLKNKDIKNASFYVQRAVNKSQPGTVQNLLSASLKNWINFEDITDLNSALNLLENIPKQFRNVKNIQKTFAYCYFDSPKTDEMFRKLTINPNVNLFRYHFFHSNYLISKKENVKTKQILNFSLNQNPRNLMLSQLKIDLEDKKISNNKFDCKNTTDVIAEIFYIISNALASQKNYVLSNYYLNFAKYLNPNFISFNTLHAENFLAIKEYEKSKFIYKEMKKKGTTYSWYAAKEIASILTEQERKKDALSILKKSFEKKKNPTLYEIFDYAEFLKNNEEYEESIKHYSRVLNLINLNDPLYGKIMDGRGVAYERTNQWDKAEIDLINSLSASPDDAYVINYLAYTWIEKGINIQKSLKMLRRANKLKPNDGYIIDSLGWALFKLKNYKEAKQYLELAVIYMDSDPVVNDHYADALWKNNKILQARYYWNYVLKLEKTEEKLKKEIKRKILFGLKS